MRGGLGFKHPFSFASWNYTDSLHLEPMPVKVLVSPGDSLLALMAIVKHQNLEECIDSSRTSFADGVAFCDSGINADGLGSASHSDEACGSDVTSDSHLRFPVDQSLKSFFIWFPFASESLGYSSHLHL